MKTAQQARGRKFDEGNIFRRLRNLLGPALEKKRSSAFWFIFPKNWKKIDKLG